MASGFGTDSKLVTGGCRFKQASLTEIGPDRAQVVVTRERHTDDDATALEVIAEAARELAVHVDTIVRLLKLSKPPVALGGGLLLRAILRKEVLAAVKSELGPVAQVADPPLGAVVLARRLLQAPGARAVKGVT